MANDGYFNENEELDGLTNEIEEIQTPKETNTENVEQINLSENNSNDSNLYENNASETINENGLSNNNTNENVEDNLNNLSTSNNENTSLKSTIDFLKSVKLNKAQEAENKRNVNVQKKKRKRVKLFASIASGIAVIAIAATITYITLFGDKKYVLNVDYGDGNSTQIEVDKNGKVTNLEDPVLKGYNFAGWFLDSEFTIPFNPSKDTIRANTTIYAKFEVKSFTITYYSNMENTPALTAQANFNTNYTLPENTFTKPNYNFVGWCLVSNPSATDVVYNAGAIRKLTEEGASYYAIWAGVEQSISYEINNLIISGKKPQVTASTMKYGDSYVIPNLEKIYGGTSNHKDYNKYFLGFKIAGDTTNKTHKYGDTIVVNGNITFTEVWGECTNNLSLVLNDGTTTGETSFNFVTGYQITLPTATKNNFILKGWNTNSSGTGTMYAAGELYSVTSSENAKLYAIWEGESKNINFTFTNARVNGTLPTIENAEIGFNETYTIPTLENVKHKDFNMVFAGFTILGDTSNTVYAMGSQIKITENVTFVEHFVSTGNSLTFNLQSGTGSFSNLSYETGHSFNLPSEIPTKTNYRFMGWNTSSNGNGTMYAPNDGFIMKKGVAVLYAIWQGEKRTITFSFTDARINGIVPTIETAEINYNEFYTIPTLANVKHKDNTLLFAGFTISGDVNNTVYPMGSQIKITENVTFVEHFENTGNTLKFNLQDGTGNFTNLSYATNHNFNLPSEIPTKTNYVFMGWNTNSNGNGTMYAPNAAYVMNEGIATLYAIWQGEKRNIEFSFTNARVNGTLPTIENAEISYNETYTIPTLENVKHKDFNMLFAGFTISGDASNTVYAMGSQIKITENVTFVEHFVSTGNSLTFNLQDGWGNFDVVTYETGHSFNLPSEIPTKENYDFMGWNTNSNGTGTMYAPNDEYVMKEGNAILYAFWIGERKEVYFEFTSDAFIGDEPARYLGEFKYEQPYIIPDIENLHSKNYDKILLGFKVKSDNSGKVYAVGEYVYVWDIDNFTLIDVWVVTTNRLFIYNPQESLGNPTQTVIKTTGYSYELPNVTPTNENYTMLGYSTVSGSQTVEYAVGSSYVFTDNTNASLYIIWEAKPKTINFNKNASAATGTVSGINSKYGSVITLPSNAYAYTNYHFVGWNTNSDGTGTALPSGSAYTINFNEASITLYAMWAHNTITVTYNANGGSYVNPENTTDELDTFTQTTPRDGSNVIKKYFTCKKWSLSPTDETQVWTGLTGGNNITVYAVYERNVATLTFVGGNGGTTTLSPVQHGQGLMFTLPINGNGFSKVGYEVTGFTVNGTSYALGANVLIEESVTITPNWAEESFIEFVNTPTEALHFNSGKRVANQLVSSADVGKTIIMPRALTTEIEVNGITKYFSGWATTQNASTPQFWLAEPYVVSNTKTSLYPVYLEATITNATFTDHESGGLSIYCGYNTPETIVIPSSYNGKPVTHVDSINSQATNLILPNSVVSIGGSGNDNKIKHLYLPGSYKTKENESTLSLRNVETVVFGEGMQHIKLHGYYFQWANLKTVILPESLLSIGDGVFSDTNLTNIELPSNLQSIGKIAFAVTGLTSLTIPASVTSIGGGFVLMCPNLTNIVLESNQHFIMENGIIYNKAKTQMVYVEVSKMVDGFTFANTVTKLEDYIFSFATFTTYEVPNQITSIGEAAFGMNLNLTSVTMGDNVLELGMGAFDSSEKLSTIRLSNNIQVFKEVVFSGTALTSFNWPTSLTEIQRGAFSNVDTITKFIIPNTVKKLDEFIGSYTSTPGSKGVIFVPASVEEVAFSFGQYSSHKVYFELAEKPANWNMPNLNHFYWNASPVVYELNSDGVSYNAKFDTTNTGKLDKVFILNTYNGLPVTSVSGFENTGITEIILPDGLLEIKNYAFSGCRALTSVTIPNGVETIGEQAFYTCEGLTSVTLPNSLTTIGKGAFYACYGLTGITLPEKLTTIKASAFSGCRNLTSVTIPNSVTTIGDYAFSSCSSFTSITIPNSVTTIGEGAFSGCEKLTSIAIPTGVTIMGYGVFENCTSLTSITIPNSVTSIGDAAFTNCTSLTSITIPNSVETIGERAFKSCIGLTDIALSNRLGSIEAYAFERCFQLENITIPNSVTTIGEQAFYGCKKLTSITIPNGVTSIGNLAFMGCNGLASVTLSDSVTTIGSYAFDGCRDLTSITIPNGVTTIGNGAFAGCTNLRDITIPNSVTTIGESAFSGCNGLASVTLSDSVTTIGGYAFENCTGLTSITIPTGVTTIGEGAFVGCKKLTSITIPNSVTTIGEGAFSGCTNLRDITIPNSVTTIGGYAFENCTGLTSITIPNGVTTMGYGVFSDCTNLSNINIQFDEDISAWDPDWKINCNAELSLYTLNPDGQSYTFTGFQNTDVAVAVVIVIIPPTINGLPVTGIGESAFFECANLTRVVIPNSVTTIGEGAFAYCTSLTSVDLPTNLTTIGAGAFCGTALTSLTIPASVTSIGGAFVAKCPNLTSVILESNQHFIMENGIIYNKTKTQMVYVEASKMADGFTFANTITKLEDYIFAFCNFTTYTVPSQITSIGNSTFAMNLNLTSVTMGNNVLEIGEGAFKDCNKLKSITLSNNLTTIGENAFYGCTSLTSIDLPTNLTTIGNNAFSGCASLSGGLTLPTKLTTIGNNAFDGCTGLTSASIPAYNITTMGVYVFNGCTKLGRIMLVGSDGSYWDPNWKAGCNASVEWYHGGN